VAQLKRIVSGHFFLIKGLQIYFAAVAFSVCLNMISLPWFEASLGLFYHVCIMIRLTLSFLLLFGIVLSTSAQEQPSILLMSGKVLSGEVTGQDSLYVYYDLHKRNGKKKSAKLDLERVFSVTAQDGSEQVIYVMDTAIGNYFSVDEMRLYIKGEQDAISYYRGNWTILLGLPLTAGLGYVIPPSVFSFSVPFVYLVGTGLPRYRIPRDKVDHPELVTEPAYVLGFERAARNKRLFKSLATGLIGTSLGFALKELPITE